MDRREAKNNPYGYDSRRGVEREKRKTNWEPTKPLTAKGREQDERNRRSGGRRRSYTEKVNDEIADLEREVKEDEDRFLFLQDRPARRRASHEAAQRRSTRSRGYAAQEKAQKKSDEELADIKRRKKAKEQMEADRKWREGYAAREAARALAQAAKKED